MLLVYTIKDVKAEYFFTPFFAKSLIEAMRSVTVAVQDPQSNLSRFVDDFTLYQVGSFDDLMGTFISKEPILIAPLNTLVKKT